MPLGEFILELIGQAIFELMIHGIGRFVRAVYYWLRKRITGKERTFPELERIKRRYLFKKFRLRSNLNDQMVKGTRGTVLEVIDEQNLFVELEDANGKPMIVNDEKVFQVARKNVLLERINRKRRRRRRNANGAPRQIPSRKS